MMGDKLNAAVDAAEIITAALANFTQVEVDVVPFGSTVLSARADTGTLESLRTASLGGTDTAGAIRHTLETVFGRSGKRQKAMFIVTDGQPRSGAATQAMLRECRKARVNVATIGIQMSETAGRDIFSIGGPYITCDNADKLSRTLPILAKRAVRVA